VCIVLRQGCEERWGLTRINLLLSTDLLRLVEHSRWAVV